MKRYAVGRSVRWEDRRNQKKGVKMIILAAFDDEDAAKEYIRVKAPDGVLLDMKARG